VRVQPAVWISADEVGNPDLVDAARFHARHLRLPLPSEIGIALAHRAVYDQIVHEPGREWAVVFEDDALVHNINDLTVRLHEIVGVLPNDRACIVNLNYTAARPLRTIQYTAITGLWRPIVPTYTTTAYLLNRLAAELLLKEQLPVRAQADWPTECRKLFFLQETRALVEPRQDVESVADPTGSRALVPKGIHLLTWSWLWYFQHRKQFDGPADYWRGVLLPRLMRHLYRSQ
jgi:GR25 family glycosyltransferase involved in LPS biosynthesis